MVRSLFLREDGGRVKLLPQFVNRDNNLNYYVTRGKLGLGTTQSGREVDSEVAFLIYRADPSAPNSADPNPEIVPGTRAFIVSRQNFGRWGAALASWLSAACATPPASVPRPAEPVLADAASSVLSPCVAPAIVRADAAADAPVARSTSGPDAAALAPHVNVIDTASALDDALIERRVYRRLSMGLVNRGSARATYVLLRSKTRVRLREFGQDREGNLRIDGHENDPKFWEDEPIEEASYEGARAADGVLMRLTRTTPTDPARKWGPPPAHSLTCRAGRTPVLQAGAKLVLGGQEGAFRWSPSAVEMVSALRCQLDDDDRVPLVFAEPKNGSPGVEWAYENSDQIVQTGAYRWMPIPP
jgi:hypothetical protein